MESYNLSIKDIPFSRLIIEDKELSKKHREYAKKSREERWKAADYIYNENIATSMFNQFVDFNEEEDDPYAGDVLALAIDPTYAPALLSVGSIEYQFGRIDEGMAHFLALTTLPNDTQDIIEIIDKAGDFLIDNKDFTHARDLYSAAIQTHPTEPELHDGLSYCYAKLSQYSKAVVVARTTVKLDPDNYIYLSNLGWALVEAQEYDEAQFILEKAIELSPSNYDLPKQNLKELQKRKNRER